MPWWPFGSSRKDEPTDTLKDLKQQLRDAVDDTPESARRRLQAVEDAVTRHAPDTAARFRELWESLSQTQQTATLTLVATSASLYGIRFYKRNVRRIATSSHINPDRFRGRSVWGKVTHVGDGDGFRLYHTPLGRVGGWGWRRKVPTDPKALKDQTISVRLAGIDAPEVAHFGKPGQPMGREAMAMLSSLVLRKSVRAYVLRRDQYERVVATVFIRRWGVFRQDVGLRMLREGMATVYEGKINREFGGREALYVRAESRARARKVGIWAGEGMGESPREFKKRIGVEAEATAEEATDTKSGKAGAVGWLGRLFGRGRGRGK